jgi:hypothetical protein
MGEQTVKNIARPIGIHRIELAEHPGSTVVKSTTVEPKSELPGSNRPSLAVLPFANMSGDPEQEYFADGISEDIITGLSKLRWFFVIARNSSFTYKGKAVEARRPRVGRALRAGGQRAQGMTRECQVRFCEGLGVKFPGPTRQSRRGWPRPSVPVFPQLPES